MKKDPNIFIKHIYDSIVEIENHTAGISPEAFLRDVKTQDAVVRRIEIIGEAAKNLPADFIKKHSHIQWAEIGGMRNKLIHEYFGVDLNLVWEVVKRDIPPLKDKITKLLQ